MESEGHSCEEWVVCCACVLCVRKAVAVPVCSWSQWTVNPRGIWQSNRPWKVRLHSTHKKKNLWTCAVKMSKVTQGVWHHTHEEWHHSADSCGCAVKWYCLWLSHLCLDLSGFTQKIFLLSQGRAGPCPQTFSGHRLSNCVCNKPFWHLGYDSVV